VLPGPGLILREKEPLIGKRSTKTVLKERGTGSDPLGRRVADVEGVGID
jgi:hypothetical protein